MVDNNTANLIISEPGSIVTGAPSFVNDTLVFSATASSSAQAQTPVSANLSAVEEAAIFFAFKRLQERVRSAPPYRGSRRYASLKTGARGSSPEPIRLSRQAQNDFSHVNPHAPTRSLGSVLSLFYRLEKEGANLGFLRESDLKLIRDVQFRHGVRKDVPTAMKFMRRPGLSRRRQSYAALKNTNQPQYVTLLGSDARARLFVDVATPKPTHRGKQTPNMLRQWVWKHRATPSPS